MLDNLSAALLAGVLAAFATWVIRFGWHFSRARIEQDRIELTDLRQKVARLKQGCATGEPEGGSR